MPVLVTTWSQEQTYRYYVDLAHSRQWGLIAEYLPKPVSHSVPISYYDYRFNVLTANRIYHIELDAAAGGTRIRIKTTSRFGGTPPSYYANTNIPLDAPFSRFITPQKAVQIAQAAILADAPKGYRAQPYWLALDRVNGGVFAWDVRTSDGPLYPKPSFVHFATVDALTGAVISVRAEHNVPGIPIPPNPTLPPAINRSTPCPHVIRPPNVISGQNYNCPRLIARPVLPGDADQPISMFSQTFTNSLSLPPGYAYKDAYVAEVKILPYGVAQRQLRTGVTAFDIDNARMYVIQTIIVPHPFYSEESAPAGAHLCERAYGVIHISKDALTGTPGFGDLWGPCRTPP